tara:strand:+ start:1761 stop:1874 length:114 start_codon:yes stop_codon:yes gene_type:complete
VKHATHTLLHPYEYIAIIIELTPGDKSGQIGAQFNNP